MVSGFLCRASRCRQGEGRGRQPKHGSGANLPLGNAAAGPCSAKPSPGPNPAHPAGANPAIPPAHLTPAGGSRFPQDQQQNQRLGSSRLCRIHPAGCRYKPREAQESRSEAGFKQAPEEFEKDTYIPDPDSGALWRKADANRAASSAEL